jgi:hypothetical protein
LAKELAELSSLSIFVKVLKISVDNWVSIDFIVENVTQLADFFLFSNHLVHVSGDDLVF